MTDQDQQHPEAKPTTTCELCGKAVQGTKRSYTYGVCYSTPECKAEARRRYYQSHTKECRARTLKWIREHPKQYAERNSRYKKRRYDEKYPGRREAREQRRAEVEQWDEARNQRREARDQQRAAAKQRLAAIPAITVVFLPCTVCGALTQSRLRICGRTSRCRAEYGHLWRVIQERKDSQVP